MCLFSETQHSNIVCSHFYFEMEINPRDNVVQLIRQLSLNEGSAAELITGKSGGRYMLVSDSFSEFDSQIK